MKNIINITFILLLLNACSKEEITKYDDGNYVFFSESLPDTVIFSFFYYLEDVVEQKIAIDLTGLPLVQAEDITIQVNTKETNCPSEIYELQSNYVFRADRTHDTIFVTFKNNPELLEKEYQLVLEIESNSKLKSHYGKNGRRVFKISDIAQRPAWWTENPIEWYYLGTYSRKKYEYFLQVTGKGDLSEMTLGEIRILTLRFQHWLDSQNPKILDEDGNIMKTEIIG